jgi:hypothetical protein
VFPKRDKELEGVLEGFWDLNSRLPLKNKNVNSNLKIYFKIKNHCNLLILLFIVLHNEVNLLIISI